MTDSRSVVAPDPMSPKPMFPKRNTTYEVENIDSTDSERVFSPGKTAQAL